MKKLHSHYLGRTANDYDRVRELQPHWHKEHAAVLRLMQRHRNKRVLDAPVGTGRFISIYKALNCSLIGLDISPDMLAITEERAKEAGLHDYKTVRASAADVIAAEADISLCVRFLNLVPGEVAARVVKNLGNATREEMLIHLTSIDIDEVPVADRDAVRRDTESRYHRQRSDMEFTPHILSDFTRWVGEAGFTVAESIECQEMHGHGRTHVQRLVRA